MHELTYRSKARIDITEKEISDIMKVANAKNTVKNISGCLVFHKGVFIQILEGLEKDVMAIYDRIKMDIRHSEIELLWEGSSTERIFPDWNMAYHSVDKDISRTDVELFEKNLLMLSKISQKPTASVSLFWQSINALMTSKNETLKSARRS